MGSWPGWARIAVPTVLLLAFCWLLIWLFGAFLGWIVKVVVGLAVVIGMVVLARAALAGDGGRPRGGRPRARVR